MKGFERKNRFLSLCGLNCGLCPMFLGEYCGGCGNGNQSCSIAICSLERGKPEFCFECESYPCEKYKDFDKYDSFIVHRNQNADLEKLQRVGAEAYGAEQAEKIKILAQLLSDYNDGHRKSFFCTAVNLPELSELREVLKLAEDDAEISALPPKEKSARMAEALWNIAKPKDIDLKLNKKK